MSHWVSWGERRTLSDHKDSNVTELNFCPVNRLKTDKWGQTELASSVPHTSLDGLREGHPSHQQPAQDPSLDQDLMGLKKKESWGRDQHGGRAGLSWTPGTCQEQSGGKMRWTGLGVQDREFMIHFQERSPNRPLASTSQINPT